MAALTFVFRAAILVLLGSSCIFAAEQVLSASAPTVKERRPHENLVEYVATIRGSDGRIFQRTNRYVVLGTGLNKWDTARREWIPASDRIEIINGYGVARGGQYRVILAPSTKSGRALIDLETPGGERIALRPVGLAVTDGHGRSVFLAEVQESQGSLAAPNMMIYPDAFDLLGASICVKVGLDGVESDVILGERIDRRLLNELGIEVESAKLEVWHEVLRKPLFQRKRGVIQRRFGTSDEDHTVEFGGMSISAGTAFTTGARENTGRRPEVPVAKEFVRVEGVDFLIESVPFLEAEGELQDLPEPAGVAWLKAATIEPPRLLAASAERRGEKRRRPVSLGRFQKAAGSPRQLAMASGSGLPKGYVIDYPITLTTQTNFTFRGDTTYFVTNRVFLYGKTRLEGGAVIKTVPYDVNVQAAIRVHGDFECATTSWNPAILTARDDDTVGEILAESTGVVATKIWYSAFNLMFHGTNSVRVHDVHTKHGHAGLYFATPGPHYAWNIQAYRCYRGIEATHGPMHLRNVLLHQSIYALNPGVAAEFHGEHLTIDTAPNLFGRDGRGTLYLTNSLLHKVLNTALTNVFFERVETSANQPFAVAGRGHHYLPASSAYRNAGTSSLSPEMAKILAETTTSAPMILPDEITRDAELSAIVERDTDTPDLGFHYHPLDYLAGGVVVDGARLTVGPGVRIGAYGANAFVLRNSASFISRGEPRRMNGLIPFNAVQSESIDWNGPLVGLIQLESPAERVELTFTECAALANAPERRLLISGLTDWTNVVSDLELTHSHLANLAQTFRAFRPQKIAFFNNVIERCSFLFEQGASRGFPLRPITLSLYNNLFEKGSLSLVARQGTTPWLVFDNLFNNETLSASGFNANFAPDYNAFRIGLPLFGGSNNRFGIDVGFQDGPLGPFYLGSDSWADLRNAGSRGAGEAGLAHFTMEPAAFSREGASLVDIGFHYRAVDSAGGPPDTDGDGLLDVAEDSNENGVLDPGETSYLDRDTDLDGDSDSDELAMGTDPSDSRSLRWRSLSSWRFDQENFPGVEGQEPIAVTNVTFTAGTVGRAIDLSATNRPVILQYRGIEANGKPNVSLTRGSFRFRFQTFWASDDPVLDIPGQTNVTYRGVGPGEWVTLIETTNLAVRIDPAGTNLVITSRNAAGQTMTNLQTRILHESEGARTNAAAAATSFWFDALVTYSPEATKVYWGVPMVERVGTGIIPWNGNSTANQFVSIGSARDGTGAFKGLIEDVVIYNVPGIQRTNPWVFSAVASTNPAALNLVWNAETNTLVNIQKRALGETNWSWLPGAIGTNFVDTSVTQGQRYEYNLNSGFFATIGLPEKFGNTMTASVLGTPLETRGKVLLLVDETLAAAIQPELNTFVTNLVGDGWSVLRTDAPRHVDDYSSTEAFATNWFNITNRIAPAIRECYLQFSNEFKHILIVGHVTIPYSGNQADDGHSSPVQIRGSHMGPWASDLYYSDLDGVWNDTKTVVDSYFLENRTAPGDGKLDEDYLPFNTNGLAHAEVAVARIDFARLPAFAESEAELLKRYLTKNARYRHKELAFDQRAIGADLFFSFQSVVFADQMAAEMASKLVRLDQGKHGDFFVATNSFILGTQSSPGWVDRINDARTNMQLTTDFATNGLAPPGAFYFLRSSFMQDWNLEDNFMRAMLTPTNGGLATGWFISMGVWRLDLLAAGLELGSGWREIVSTRLKPFWGGQSARATQILGDSTLRYPVLAPPSGLTGHIANFRVHLTWTASPETNCTYNVYRARNGIDSDFVRLNSEPLTETSFSEPVVSRLPKLYMVRALKVTETGSGSFTNLSQGIFVAR